jgi:hypothetical protein
VDAGDRGPHADRHLFLYLRRDQAVRRAQFGVLEQTLVQSHIQFPHANALFVSIVEFACGAGLVLGQASGVLAWLDEFLYLPRHYTR